MMTKYQLLSVDEKIHAVLRDDKDSIPFNPDNTDYQAYLKWLAAGNTPTPAENA
jgi:hypothetical protein